MKNELKWLQRSACCSALAAAGCVAAAAAVIYGTRHVTVAEGRRGGVTFFREGGISPLT